MRHAKSVAVESMEQKDASVFLVRAWISLAVERLDRYTIERQSIHDRKASLIVCEGARQSQGIPGA
jgi:hypothetical protein